ncbi:MAG: SRPBCC family protein [Nitrososphaerales archaeon]
MNDIVARAAITIDAPAAKVWDALTKPEVIKQYMFGTNVASDWKEGSRITWQGEWQGKEYEDRGVILKLVPERTIQYSHFSPLSGVPDVPENYHTVTVELCPEGTKTRVTLTQDGNATEEEREHSEQNWRMMLEGMKQVLEK